MSCVYVTNHILHSHNGAVDKENEISHAMSDDRPIVLFNHSW